MANQYTKKAEQVPEPPPIPTFAHVRVLVHRLSGRVDESTLSIPDLERGEYVSMTVIPAGGKRG